MPVARTQESVSLVIFRLASPDDGEDLQRIYAPVVNQTAISFELLTPTSEEMGVRVANTLPTYPWIVAVDNADAGMAGYAYAGAYAAREAYQWSVSVSIYLSENARGQGLGRRLYGALFAILAEQGFRQAVAGIALPNDASVGLHESLGFERVGVFQNVGWKFDRWHGVGHWQKPISTALAQPVPTRSVDELPEGLVVNILNKYSK